MIVEERMRTFINSLDPGTPQWLDDLRGQALADDVPIIRTEMGSLLRFLLTMHRPASILEVGTAVGYSALLMSEYMPEGCHITTIEKYEKRIPIARENFHKAGLHASLTYYIDYESEAVKSFLMKYRALFNTEPTQFAFQGYDVAKYFIGLCANYGDDWKNHLNKEHKMLQSTFMMNNSENGGYSNKGIRRILYGDRYSVETIR